MDISLSITKQLEKHTLTFIYLIMYFVSHLMHVFYYLIIEVRVCKYLTMTMNSIKHNGSWLKVQLCSKLALFPSVSNVIILFSSQSQMSSTLLLETHCPAKFISNLLQNTCLHFQANFKSLLCWFRCDCLGLELNWSRTLVPQEEG